MDFEGLELKRETIFKDAVLSQAEARGMEIVANAGKKRAEALEAAYAQCDLADPAVIRKEITIDNERQYASIASEAHKEMLAYREELVAGLFDAVAQKLEAFTREDKYEDWLKARLEKHKDFTGTGEGITLFLREADMRLAEGLKKALPGCEVKAAKEIRLGGLKISNGKVLYNETLDDAMTEQKERFYASGELRL